MKRHREGAAALDGLLIRGLGFDPPLPGVVERLDLRGCLGAVLLEDDVVALAALEGRVEIHQIHQGVGDMASQDVKVVPIEEPPELLAPCHTAILWPRRSVAKYSTRGQPQLDLASMAPQLSGAGRQDPPAVGPSRRQPGGTVPARQRAGRGARLAILAAGGSPRTPGSTAAERGPVPPKSPGNRHYPP